MEKNAKTESGNSRAMENQTTENKRTENKTVRDKIKAVLFDMDGLMVDTERVSARAWKKVGEEEGLEIKESWLCTIRGTSAAVCRERFYAFYGKDKDFESIYQRKKDLVTKELRENGIPVKKGLKELLSFLKEEGIQIALATSTKQEAARWYLESIGVLPYFDAFACGDMVKECKPNPELFLLAASKLGRKPEECMVLEDSLQGIEAARRGGFLPVMVPDLTMPTEDTRKVLYAECEDLSQVIRLFEKE
ncbi:MAG: HAD family phosphatase [bacterium]|nr:HAD family phosphatase [bacterium]